MATQSKIYIKQWGTKINVNCGKCSVEMMKFEFLDNNEYVCDKRFPISRYSIYSTFSQFSGQDLFI